MPRVAAAYRPSPLSVWGAPNFGRHMRSQGDRDNAKEPSDSYEGWTKGLPSLGIIPLPLIFGTRLAGLCCEVRGFLHIATHFVHLFLVPIVPLKSYIVVTDNEDPFESKWMGVPIGLSWRSILLAWARALCLYAVFAGIVGALVLYFVENEPGLASGFVVSTVIAFVGFILSYRVTGLGRATLKQALELADRLVLPDDGRIVLQWACGAISEADARAKLRELPLGRHDGEPEDNELRRELQSKTEELKGRLQPPPQ